MKAIENTEVIVEAVGRWSPTDVAFIRELRFVGNAEQPAGGPAADVFLRLLLQPRPPLSAGWPDPEGKFWEVDVLFRRVREFAVAQAGTGDIQVEGFTIEDLSGSQLEGIGLRVYDLRSERISFWAAGASVLSCREAGEGPTASPYGRIYPGEFPGGPP